MSNNITIGTISLTDKDAPRVSTNIEYYKTDNNIIIGGKRNITISGTTSVSDDGSSTGATVMKKLKTIRDGIRNSTGKALTCVSVTIPNVYSGRARISNINIEQGPDPTWVNQGSYSISIEAPLTSIPPNSLGIVASDYLKSLSFSEKIELGEDSHGFVYTADVGLSKAFIKFSCRVSAEIDPICASVNRKTLLENIIKKFLKTSPSSNGLMSRYANFKVFLQDRSYETNNNSASLNCEVILMDPSTQYSAYVDLNFNHTKNYETDEEKKIISGNVRGLTNVSWSNIISLNSVNTLSKINNASAAFDYIKGKYNNVNTWAGIDYELIKQNCNTSGTNNNDCSLRSSNNQAQEPCFGPVSSSVGRSRTDGNIDFTFEWSTTKDDCNKNNSTGVNIEYQVDDQMPQNQYVEFTIPTVGILLQNLSCANARRISFTSTMNFPEGNCSDQAISCDQLSKFNLYITLYLRDRKLPENDYLLTEFTYSKNNRANTIKKSFISKCRTDIT